MKCDACGGDKSEAADGNETHTCNALTLTARENLRAYIDYSRAKGFRVGAVLFASRATAHLLGVEIGPDGWGEFEGNAVKVHEYVAAQWAVLCNRTRDELERGEPIVTTPHMDARLSEPPPS